MLIEGKLTCVLGPSDAGLEAGLIREYVHSHTAIREIPEIRNSRGNCSSDTTTSIDLREPRRGCGPADAIGQVVSLHKVPCEIGIKTTQNLFEVVKASALSSPQSQNL